MIERKFRESILSLFLAVLFSITFGQTCLALDLSNNLAFSQSSPAELSFPLLPQHAVKPSPIGMEIYQYDNSPLGSRKPLLLVHGLLGEIHPCFRWHELAEYLDSDIACQSKFKIYLVRYNSSLALADLTREFAVAVRKLAPNGGLTVIAISMAGTIVRDSMVDPAVNQRISRVVTLGSFFRGSPLFCREWMKKSIRKRHLSPFYRFERQLGYKIYFARHKNLSHDFAWDNVDNQEPRETMLANKPENEDQSHSLIAVSLASSVRPGSDGKFVVYAGYLHNQYFPKKRTELRTFVVSPFVFLRSTLPAHFGREHQALRLLNYLIADAVPGKEGSPKFIYTLNDGISPISSGLLLSDEFAANTSFTNEAVFDKITSHSNAGKPRLFDNVDHLSYIERHRPRSAGQNVTDLLSKNEPARPIFAWVLNDILE